MNKKVFDISKNHTKPGNPYYLVLFVNRTKLGTVLIETVLSGESLYSIRQGAGAWAKVGEIFPRQSI